MQSYQDCGNKSQASLKGATDMRGLAMATMPELPANRPYIYKRSLHLWWWLAALLLMLSNNRYKQPGVVQGQAAAMIGEPPSHATLWQRTSDALWGGETHLNGETENGTRKGIHTEIQITIVEGLTGWSSCSAIWARAMIAGNIIIYAPTSQLTRWTLVILYMINISLHIVRRF